MAKKKQLAGKKTKLAKLPLTQALANQTEEPAPWGPPPVARPVVPSVAPRQLPFTWEEAQKGVAGPLAALYLHLVRELAALSSRLQPAVARAPDSHQNSLPPQVPPPPQILGALRLAREGLRDLRHLLTRL
jgi:hypothetical protein